MLKIGDFSKLAHVTVKTLRHYGRIGLFSPTHVDRFSGYRYYGLEQLPRLNRILALKDLGFSLEQIARLLDQQLAPEQLRAMLQLKQAELTQQLDAERARLEQVGTRLRQIEEEGVPPAYEVTLKHIPAQTVAMIELVLPGGSSLAGCCLEYRPRLQGWLEQAAIRWSGAWFATHPEAEYSDEVMELQLAVEVDPTCLRRPKLPAAPPGCSLRKLPEVPLMASVLHLARPGEPAGMDLPPVSAYAALYAWIEANGYRSSGPARELFLDDPADPDSTCRAVEVQMPVERISRRPRQEGATGASEPTNTFEESEGVPEMQPKIITKPAFMVMGTKYVGRNQHQEISQQWAELNPRYHEIPVVKDSNAYGICYSGTNESAEEGAFEYVASFEVERADHLPEGMVVRMIPEQKYAVFEHRGGLETLGQTYNNIYQVWLPQSGLQIAAPFDMEVYTDEFKNFAPDSVFYIYVPVK